MGGTTATASPTDASAPVDPADPSAARQEPTPYHRLGELDRFQRAWILAVLLATLMASAVLAQRLHREGWTPISDEANQVHGAEVAWRERPLVGDANTANFYGNPPSQHPGPFGWYALAPFVRLLGPQTGAWAFGIASNLTAAVLAAWLAFRSGGFRVGAIVLLGSLVAFCAVASGQWASPFFQFLPLIPFLAFLMGCWAVARGDTWALAPTIVAGSYVLQLATVNLPLLVACGVVALAGATLRIRRHGAQDRFWLHLGAAGLVTLVLWLPPLWDQVFGTGNLGKLARVKIPHRGWPGAIEALDRLVDPMTGGLVVGAVVLGLALAASRRRPVWPSGRGLLPLGAVAVAALLGTAVTGFLLPAGDVETTHQLWIPMVGVLGLAAATAVFASPQPLDRRSRIVGVAGTVLVLTGALSTLATTPSQSPDDADAMRAVDATVGPILAAMPPGPLRVVYRGSWPSQHVAAGLVARLEARGRPSSLGTVSQSDALLVVLRSRPTPWQVGRVVASHRPSQQPEVPPGFAAAVERWARAHGSLPIDPDRRFVLANLLDGRAATLCLDDLLAHPEHIFDLGPDLAVRLYGAQLLRGPALPPKLDHVNQWMAEQPVTVLDVPPPAAEDGGGGTDGLLFSRSSC